MVPIVGGRGGGVGSKAGIALVEKVMPPYAEHLAGGQGFALAYGWQAAAALAFASEPDAINRFGKHGVTIAGLAIGHDHVIGGPAEFARDAVGGGGEGVFVVRMGRHNQQLGMRGPGGKRPRHQRLWQSQQESLACHCVQ